ncbi:MAG TPA: hypoxanthine phosphoribosyltransferase [Phycisphaerae bacterium]|nr:hypoxanthine phosphoribosyltransferase [Phycisphaerae bacterium]
MERDLQRVLISKRQLAERVCGLAAEITATYPDVDAGLTLVTVLSGSIIFLADLIRHLPMKMKLGLVTVSSYAGPTTKSRGPRLVGDLNVDVAGRDVLIVDDILDTGRTLRFVQQRLAELEPRSLRTVVLLRKPAKAPDDLIIDFVGFDIEDDFVVGYGLDFNNQYRNLPQIAVLKPELYAATTPA